MYVILVGNGGFCVLYLLERIGHVWDRTGWNGTVQDRLRLR